MTLYDKYQLCIVWCTIQYRLWVYDESKAGSGLNDVVHTATNAVRHETDERKHNEPGEEAEDAVVRSNEIFFGI